MQKERLTLKLPMDPLALRHAGGMLLALAAEMTGGKAVVSYITDGLAPAAAAPAAPAAAPAAPEATALETGGEQLPPPNTAGAGNLLPAPAAPVGVTLDDAKRPWDNRIHGSGKTFLKTGDRAGCWKYKKQLDPAVIEEVEAELDAAMAVAAPAPAEGTVLPGRSGPPAAPPAPAAAPVAPAATAAETAEPPAMDFAGVVEKVTALQNAGRITPEQIAAVVKAAGLPSFALLGSRPDLIPTINAEIDKLCPPIQ